MGSSYKGLEAIMQAQIPSASPTQDPGPESTPCLWAKLVFFGYSVAQFVDF